MLVISYSKALHSKPAGRLSGAPGATEGVAGGAAEARRDARLSLEGRLPTYDGPWPGPA